jgi:hypothetical protein
VSFVQFRHDIAATPLMRGLPDDHCQCPHWGYVIKGRMTMGFADREEIYQAGEAYDATPGIPSTAAFAIPRREAVSPANSATA